MLPNQSQALEMTGDSKPALLRVIAADASLKPFVDLASKERELAVLGTVILDNAKYYETGLSPLEFINVEMAIFWHNLGQMIQQKLSIDELSVAQRVAQSYDKLPYEQCVAIVTRATAKGLDDLLFAQYCTVIQEMDIRIRAIHATKTMMASLSNLNTPLLDVLSQSDALWYKATDLPSKQEDITQSLESIRTELGNQRYCLTGWPNVDKWAGGFPLGNVVIWAGLSGEGKTTGLLDTVLYQLQGGKRVVIFLADTQGKDEIILKMLAKLASKSPDTLRPEDMTSERMAEIAAWRWVLIDDCKLTPANIRRRLMREERNESIDLVIIEGLYLCYDDEMSISLDQALHAPKVLEKLITFVKGKPYPIVMSHQLKASLGSRENKIPTGDDLRGHQALYHIAQSVFAFIQNPNKKGAAQVYCLKHRRRDRNGQYVELLRNNRHGYCDPDQLKDADEPPF